MTDVTRILNRIHEGDQAAAADLLPLVYAELRQLAIVKMARERPGQTLQATALVHEAYLRLVGSASDKLWEHRGHFFAAAAEAMRRILVENARRKQSRKHGGAMVRAGSVLDAVPGMAGPEPLETLAVHDLLDRLADVSPRAAELVKLRYFLGCTMPETAEILGIAQKTAEQDWTYAKAWLRRQWRRDGEEKNATDPKK